MLMFPEEVVGLVTEAAAPGPGITSEWYPELHEESGLVYVIDETFNPIAEALPDGARAWNNACLMASAPDLLRALERIVTTVNIEELAMALAEAADAVAVVRKMAGLPAERTDSNG